MAIRYLSNFDSDGTSLGQSITDKVSLYGETPVAQRASASQAAVATTGSTKTTPAGFTTTTQANAIVTLVNEMRTVLVDLGAMKGAA
jgi:hypothetical protein